MNINLNNKTPIIVALLFLNNNTNNSKWLFPKSVLSVSATRGQQLAGSRDSFRFVRTTTMRAVIQRVTKASVTGKRLF